MELDRKTTLFLVLALMVGGFLGYYWGYGVGYESGLATTNSLVPVAAEKPADEANPYQNIKINPFE